MLFLISRLVALPRKLTLLGYAIALPISFCHFCGAGCGLGESPPFSNGSPSHIDVPGELLVCSVLIWLPDPSSGSNHEKFSLCLESPLPLSRGRPLILDMLLALKLLLPLFVRACPGGAFDKRELCRFTVAMNGSAPGIVSSVRPTREFGARA